MLAFDHAGRQVTEPTDSDSGAMNIKCCFGTFPNFPIRDFGVLDGLVGIDPTTVRLAEFNSF